jgi:hypothetical protein
VLKTGHGPPGDDGGMDAWSVIGIIAAAVLALGGLFIIGVIVVLLVGLNQFAQNK